MLNRRDVMLSGLAGAVLGGAGHALADPHGKPTDKHPLDGTPLAELHMHLCAFHVGKKKPEVQVEAHHYCMPLSDELFQCVIFEDHKPKARLLGVEYIISDRLYQLLDAKEKEYWHPHTYEVTSGLLVVPELSEADENKFMKSVLKTWGKTWHVWPDPETNLPIGEPALQWSFTKDGQIRPELVAARDRKLKMNTEAVKKRRKEAMIE